MSRAPTSHFRCAHFQASCGMKCSRNLSRLRRSAGSLHDKARDGPSGFCAACFRQSDRPRSCSTGSGPPSKGWPNTKPFRSEEHTSELQSLMRISYAVFCLKTKKHTKHRYTDDKTNQHTTEHMYDNRCHTH